MSQILVAKYEKLEFFLADFLLVSGGMLVGFGGGDPIQTTTSGSILIGIGFFFGLRVLKKFQNELTGLRQDIRDTQQKTSQANEKIAKTNDEIDRTQLYLDSTMDDLKRSKKEIERLVSDIYPRNTVTNPKLFIRRFESIENYTMFYIDKQPILLLYKKLISANPISNFKSVQDMKLIKLFSLVYNLIWFNNSLLHYNGQKIIFEPLISLMVKKNRYYHLCKLKVYEYGGEIDFNLENKIGSLVDACYNSMIDSQDIGFTTSDPEMVVKEHSVKVVDLNEQFKELFNDVNDFLSVKFPEVQCKVISNLQISI